MQSSSAKSRLFLVLALILTPWMAQANPGHGGTSFGHGLLHPLSGLDHICAMLAVGMWAAQRGGRATWMMPLAFLAMMFSGAILASLGVNLPQVEAGIALSVLILGLLVAAAVRLPIWAGAMVVGAFAVLHGHAHALETAPNAVAWAYDSGFLLSTAALHAVGILFGMAVARFGEVSLVRYTGGAIALCGVVLIVG